LEGVIIGVSTIYKLQTYQLMNFKTVLDLFFPLRCAGCQRTTKNEPLCAECFASIPIYDTLFCGECKARSPAGKKICHPKVPYLLAAATDFHNPVVTSLIHALKFQYISSAAIPLARLTAQYLNTVIPETSHTVVVPVPLSKRRARARGYNQSELIAAPLAAYLQIPFETCALSRIKNSDPQSTLHGGNFARAENIRGCFAVTDSASIAEKNILLVDDVTTSGATFSECARALKSSGARQIIAVASAKA
jgi:competence protein ComFC